uniref:Transmembrane inner ear expressed protein n=2 Tax=Stomoxys calcitrans TaxID=35570 RepID=A0A1I8PF60_STOCA
MSDDGEGDFMNIDPETAWLESTTIGGFRVWHIIAICLGILMSIIIMVCCCIRFRIPRTKQEIEADYQRKQITKKFREKLQQIKNSEMDDMDLQKDISYTYRTKYNEKTLYPCVHLAWQSTLYYKSINSGYETLSHHKEIVFHQYFLKEVALEAGHLVYPTPIQRPQCVTREPPVAIHSNPSRSCKIKPYYINDYHYHSMCNQHAAKDRDVNYGCNL